MLIILSSRHIILTHKLLGRFLLNDRLLDVIIGTQEGVVDLRSRNMATKCRIEHVLRSWILLDGLDMGGNGNVQI